MQFSIFFIPNPMYNWAHTTGSYARLLVRTQIERKYDFACGSLFVRIAIFLMPACLNHVFVLLFNCERASFLLSTCLGPCMSVQVEKEIRKRSATLIDSSSGHTSSTSNISVQFSHSLNQSRHLDEELLNLQDKNNTGQSTRGRWSSLIFHIGSFAKPPKRRNSDDPLRILGNPSFEAFVKQSGNTDCEEINGKA